MELNLDELDPGTFDAHLKVTSYTGQILPANYLESSPDEPNFGTFGVNLKIASYIGQISPAAWGIALTSQTLVHSVQA